MITSNQDLLSIQIPQQKLSQLYFQASLTQSKTKLTQFLITDLENLKTTIEDRVFISTTATVNQYLTHIYTYNIQIGKLQKIELQALIAQKFKKIQDDIISDNLQVFKKKALRKQDLYHLQKLNQQKLIKIKEGELQQNINELELKMDRNMFDSQNIQNLLDRDILDQNYYDSNHPKTKQVLELISRLKKQKQLISFKKLSIAKRELIRMNRNNLQKQQQRTRQKQKKHQQLIARLQQKQFLKIQEQEKRKENQQEFKSFLHQFKKKKKLDQIKQEEFFQKVLLPEQQKKAILIQQLKQKYKPISTKQIDDHQIKYLTQKISHKLEKAQEFKIQKELSINNSNQCQKRRSRYWTLQQNKQIGDVKQIQSKQKTIRKLNYSEKVRKQFIPMIDPIKKQQLKSIIEKNQYSRRQRNSSANQKFKQGNILDNSYDYSKIDGLKNLQQLHKFIQLHKRQGKIKYSNKNNTISLEPKLNYLKQLRQKRQQLLPKTNRLAESYDLGKINKDENEQLKVFLMDQKTKRRQKFLRHNKNNISIQNLKQENHLEQDYLTSIKMKINLLGKKQ